MLEHFHFAIRKTTYPPLSLSVCFSLLVNEPHILRPPTAPKLNPHTSAAPAPAPATPSCCCCCCSRISSFPFPFPFSRPIQTPPPGLEDRTRDHRVRQRGQAPRVEGFHPLHRRRPGCPPLRHASLLGWTVTARVQRGHPVHEFLQTDVPVPVLARELAHFVRGVAHVERVRPGYLVGGGARVGRVLVAPAGLVDADLAV